MDPKPSEESLTVMNEMVLPSDSNALGTAFGGKVMQWVDIGAAMAAQRHCRKKVVTAAIDELHFKAPIRIGMIASLTARVSGTFNRSLEVSVDVHSEDAISGERKHCCQAILTFAALDDNFKPTKVTPLCTKSEVDQRNQTAAEKRRALRLSHRELLY